MSISANGGNDLAKWTTVHQKLSSFPSLPKPSDRFSQWKGIAVQDCSFRELKPSIFSTQPGSLAWQVPGTVCLEAAVPLKVPPKELQQFQQGGFWLLLPQVAVTGLSPAPEVAAGLCIPHTHPRVWTQPSNYCRFHCYSVVTQRGDVPPILQPQWAPAEGQGETGNSNIRNSPQRGCQPSGPTFSGILNSCCE